MKPKIPKVLFFDIETTPYQAWIWQTGKQYVGHRQLVANYDEPKIICLAYCWNDNKPAKSIDWNYEKQDSRELVRQFDEIVKEADHVIGKNSDRFDIPMINAVRMLNGLPGLPSWFSSKDDLEKQMRKYFRLPSQSLDYISKRLGFGGKIPMEFEDWINIYSKNDNGLSSFKKMIKYCKKDVEDTRKIWDILSEHFDPKFNMATYTGQKVCKHVDCGSANLGPNGHVYKGVSIYQQYRCYDCGRYAGCTLITPSGKEGKIK